ncbi:MAG TPA: isochorismatase family protein [Actinomycetota bacterium]|jgi:nicotinamidase/pyrazinamidase
MTEYDAGTALLVVDVQNDFADPQGSLYVARGEAVPAAVNPEIARARAAGALIVYSQDWHPAETPHFAAQGGVWPVHCVGGTWGAEFHPDLDVADDALVLRKGTGGEDGYSVFTVRDPDTGEEAATALERILREHGVRRVVVAGLATDYCVKDTVLDARHKGFPVTVLTDAIRAVNLAADDGARAERQMRDAGADLV